MPDQYGFNHLGDNVRCIDCPTGGPIGHWPEHKRARHARGHDTGRKQSATDVRRMRILAAPPTDSNEEKEAITMANTANSKGEPAKQVAIDVLRKAGKPLHAKEIAKRVLASGRCAGLKGKTQEATISAMLAVGSKPSGPFTRVDKSTYTLVNAPGTPAKARETAESASEKPAATRKTRQAPKPTGRTRTKRASAKRSR